MPQRQIDFNNKQSRDEYSVNANPSSLNNDNIQKLLKLDKYMAGVMSGELLTALLNMGTTIDSQMDALNGALGETMKTKELLGSKKTGADSGQEAYNTLQRLLPSQDADIKNNKDVSAILGTIRSSYLKTTGDSREMGFRMSQIDNKRDTIGKEMKDLKQMRDFTNKLILSVRQTMGA